MRWLTLVALVTALLVLFAPVPPAGAKGGGLPCFATLSGGDLPHPVTAAAQDCYNAIARAGDSRTLPARPDVTNLPAYLLDQGEARLVYYPRPDAVGVVYCEACDANSQWTTADTAVDRMFRRYIELAKADRIDERPTWSTVLAASEERWSATASIVASDGGQSVDLRGHAANELVKYLAAAGSSPVNVGVRGTPGGSGVFGSHSLSVKFGGMDELEFLLVLPGEYGERAFLFDGRDGSSGVAYLVERGLARVGYQAPAEFDDFLASKGLTGHPSGLEARIVPLPDVVQSPYVAYVRQIAVSAGGQEMQIDLRGQNASLDYFYRYLGPGEQLHPRSDEQPVSLRFDLEAPYDPFPETYLPVEALYYPVEGYLYLPHGVQTGSGQLDPGWAVSFTKLQSVVASALGGGVQQGESGHGNVTYLVIGVVAATLALLFGASALGLKRLRHRPS